MTCREPPPAPTRCPARGTRWLRPPASAGPCRVRHCPSSSSQAGALLSGAPVCPHPLGWAHLGSGEENGGCGEEAGVGKELKDGEKGPFWSCPCLQAQLAWRQWLRTTHSPDNCLSSGLAPQGVWACPGHPLQDTGDL